MNVSKGTIVRLLLVLLVGLNLILGAVGIDPIKLEGSEVGAGIEAIVQLAVIFTAAWKNNSVSQAAIKADEFMKKLKASESYNSVKVEE